MLFGQDSWKSLISQPILNNMPELPEVQSSVDYLAPRLKGRSITECSILWERTLATHSQSDFKKLILNHTIYQVTRRGKFIVIWLKSGKHKSAILIHLRMSGTVEVISSKISRDPYDRIILSLNNNKELRFNDVRKFGKIYLCDDPTIILNHLGIEPLAPDFSNSKLLGMLKNKAGAIKPLLLNQRFIAGIGNIYADESLWLARIHPLRTAKSLKEDEISALHSAIVKILNEAIELKGTDNGDEVVSGGLYQPKVYGRTNSACLRCGDKLSRIVVAQRGTHFCKTCQKPPRKSKN